MAKQLLTSMQVAKRLGICRARFYDLQPKLIAKGLKVTRVGKYKKYLESSLEELIDKAISTDRPVV